MAVTTKTCRGVAVAMLLVNVATSALPTLRAEPQRRATDSYPTSCPQACDNLGFDWAYFKNIARNEDTTYSSFHPAHYKFVNPEYVSTTSLLGGTYGDDASAPLPPGPIYNSTQDFPLAQFAINQHAYFYACEQDTTFTVNIPYSNDAVYLWTGQNAYTGWLIENADLIAVYNQPQHIPGSASWAITVPAQTYMPIRFVLGQAQNGGGFNITVTTSGGEIVASDSSTYNSYVVRYSCNNVTAPPFPPFGHGG